MSTFNELINTIRAQAAQIAEEESDDDTLQDLFVRAIKRSMREIREGADSEDFSDLTIANFLIMGSESKFTVQELRDFIEQLKSSSSKEN